MEDCSQRDVREKAPLNGNDEPKNNSHRQQHSPTDQTRLQGRDWDTQKYKTTLLRGHTTYYKYYKYTLQPV